MRDRQTTSANKVETAVAAGPTAGSIGLGQVGMVDLLQPAMPHISYGGWKLATGVDVSVGKKRYEVEGRAAPVPRASAKRIQPFFFMDNVNQIVLQPHNRILMGSGLISYQERSKSPRLRHLQRGPFSDGGQPVECEEISPFAE